jgi:hypothetical protein
MSAAVHPDTIRHLDAVTATADEGFLVISAPMPEKAGAPLASWSFHVSEVDAAAQAAAELDAAGRNVYVRTSLLAAPLYDNGKGWSSKRGGADGTGAAIALVTDLDIDGPGHANVPGRLPLPPDIATGQRIFDGLPRPSLIVNTGGGQHLWWLLDEPATDDPVGLLDAWAERVVWAGGRGAFHVDKPDPARVLRVAGTHRRKSGLDVNRVEIVGEIGWRYGWRELLEALPAPEPSPAPPPRSTSPRNGRLLEPGPIAAVSMLTWAEILEPLGWTFTGYGPMGRGVTAELWLRPGDSASAYSLKCLPDGPAVAWSDNCGLPVGRGQRLNKWRVYVALHHPGETEGSVASQIRARSKELARA